MAPTWPPCLCLVILLGMIVSQELLTECVTDLEYCTNLAGMSSSVPYSRTRLENETLGVPTIGSGCLHEKYDYFESVFGFLQP
jgi:hypothetical protein